MRLLLTLPVCLLLAAAPPAISAQTAPPPDQGDGDKDDDPKDGGGGESESCGTWKLVEDKMDENTDEDTDGNYTWAYPPFPQFPFKMTSGEGLAEVQAWWFAMNGEASAWDETVGYDIRVTADANGMWYQKWSYETKGDDEGEAAVEYELGIEGALSLVNADASAAIYGWVHFHSSLGPDQVMDLSWAKATGTKKLGSIGITGPYGLGIALDIELGTKEGDYPAPAQPNILGATNPTCVELVTFQRRTMAYVDAFADGGWFNLDRGECNADIYGVVYSDLDLGTCCDEH